MEKDIILEIAIKKLSEAFDDFISACLDADKNIIAPDKKSVMQARACLPPYCKNAFTKR